MKTRVSLKYFSMIVASCLYFTIFYNNARDYVIFPKIKLDALLEHRINDVKIML